jgi:hypothetical protein
MFSATRGLMLSRTVLRAISPAILALTAAGCGPAVLDVQVQLVTQTCSQGVDPLTKGAYVRFTLFGTGIDSTVSQTSSTVPSGTATIPSIPVGTGRNIVAEVLDTNLLLLARGETGPVDFDGKQTKPVSMTIFLRPVNSFLYANSAASPTNCTTLQSARVNHTATVLENGKVLIAGGLQESGGSQTTYLNTTEIYDPVSGTTSPGPTMLVERAFHTSTHLPGTNYTVIAGGENSGGALKEGELYDESANAFTGPLTMTTARSRHSAAVPLALSAATGQPGIVILFGGNGASGSPESSVEVFDPSNYFLSTPIVMPEGRSEAGAVAVPGGVIVVGGWSGSVATKDVSGVSTADGSHYNGDNLGLSLTNAHIFPLVGTLGDGSVVVMDGFSGMPSGSADLLTEASNTIEVIDPTLKMSTAVSSSNAPTDLRGFGGAVSLLDGTMLVAGGGAGSGTELKASSTAQIIYTSSSGVKSRATTNSMSDARVGATYTLMKDGSVLITGGYNFQSNNKTALTTIEIYEPEYQILNDNPYL